MTDTRDKQPDPFLEWVDEMGRYARRPNAATVSFTGRDEDIDTFTHDYPVAPKPTDVITLTLPKPPVCLICGLGNAYDVPFDENGVCAGCIGDAKYDEWG